MGWFQGSGLRGTKWVLVGLGLLLTSCVGAAGAGAAVVIVGAGALAFTCYDRVSVTVTDRLTATKLCDAKVSFWKGDSETVATSCYQAALSAGKYKLRVERRGLITFEESVEVTEGGDCGGTVQTMYVALDRKSRGAAPPTAIQAPATTPPAAATASPVAPAAPPPAAPPPAVVPPPSAVAPSAPLPAAPPPPPAAPPPPPAAAPAPASTAFPDAPH